MSDSDEDNYQFLGKLLEPYDEDAVPKKKAFNIEDQVATDEQGRRRFHGAFTGGFSAGFFNTVGSLEGWKPTEFKSSRSEKAAKKFQTPKDFMDDEDMGEFGIAPTAVRATSDYSNQVANRSNKRRIKHAEGPIPGVPVLHSILQPAKDTVGVKLLKKMGWKPGQGVGPRLTRREKNRAKRENQGAKVYGCVIPDEFRRPIEIDSESSSDSATEEFTFAPDDYDPFIYQPKDNSFGMGYQGLDKTSIHISLFDPPEFRMQDFNNKKVSIAGQAFGVGAFEHEDEDIYTRDDMSKYDFQLETTRKKTNKKSPKKQLEGSKENILDGFTVARNTVVPKKTFPPPVLPKNFIPKHGIRISRFEPLPETHKYYNYDRTKARGRHDMTALERTKIFNADASNNQPRKEFVQSTTLITSTTEENQSTTTTTSPSVSTKPLITKTATSSSQGVFKPFITNPEKQKRYEDYLALDEREQLSSLQPASMTDWEKQNERNEFEQASRLYRPVAGLVFDRFITASDQSDGLDLLKKVEKSVYQHGTEEMRQAAKMKMFGKLTRTVEVWIPSKLLCKRFNVPEPEVSEMDKKQITRKPKAKFSVFDYYEAHQLNKAGTEIEQKTNLIDIDKPVSKENSSFQSDLTQKPNITDTILASEESEPKTLQIEDTKSSNSLIIPSTSSNITESKVREVSNTLESSKTSKKLTAPEPTPMPTDPKEKLDLFRAIFLSSSESESEHEPEPKNAQDKITEMKKIVLKDTSIKPDMVIETQRVNKGIFAGLDLRQMNQTEESSSPLKTAENELVTTTTPIVNIYGPQLPVQISRDKKETVWKPSFHKVTSQIESSSSEDEWMEKSSAKTKEKSSKKSKKHKSEGKSKHKKHKSKHKKKKHSDKH